MENKIIIAGFGGQGILFFGRILAYAAMLENKEVTWFPSYGAEVRGGTANCTVIISDELIGSPVVGHPNILIVMNDASLEKFQPKLKQNGLLIVDSSLIKVDSFMDDLEILRIPATEISSKIGSIKSANMVLLGSVIAQTGILMKKSVFNALTYLTPEGRKKTLEMNKKAIAEGMRCIEDKKS